MIGTAPLERKATRYGCPFCGKWRSSRLRTISHICRCWKNPAARSCGSCEHHIPPTKPEPADYWTGYPGAPSEPRGCMVDQDMALGMPRACPLWVPDLEGAQHAGEPREGLSERTQTTVQS